MINDTSSFNSNKSKNIAIYEWKKATHVGECRKCKQKANGGDLIENVELNKNDLCEKHAKKKKYMIIIIILLSLIVLGVAGWFAYQNRPIYEDLSQAKWSAMSDDEKQAWVNEKQRQSSMPLNIANPIYGHVNSEKVCVNMTNSKQYMQVVKQGEYIYTGDDGLSGELRKVENTFNKTYDNKYDEKLTITMSDTNDVLYESDFVRPGYGIEFATFNRTLDAGEYMVDAKVTSFDNNHNVVGNSTLQVKLIIKQD